MNFEKARLFQAEADHEVQRDRKVPRQRRGEQGEDRENTTNARGESKVMLQDITRKRMDVNCVEKKTWSRTRTSSKRLTSRT